MKTTVSANSTLSGKELPSILKSGAKKTQQRGGVLALVNRGAACLIGKKDNSSYLGGGDNQERERRFLLGESFLSFSVIAWRAGILRGKLNTTRREQTERTSRWGWGGTGRSPKKKCGGKAFQKTVRRREVGRGKNRVPEPGGAN